MADPEIEIVEISVPPQYQLAIARVCIAAGKHLLCQKPLSDTLPHAAEIVRLAREGGVKLAVNQQLRWGQGLRAAKNLISKGWIGQVTDASIQVSVNTPWDMWGWLVVSPRLEVLYHSIHYIDAMRSILGDPVWVTSRHARYPLQGGWWARPRPSPSWITVTTCRRSSPTTTTTTATTTSPSSASSAPRGSSPARWARCTTTRTGGPTRWSGAARRYYPDKRFEAKLEGKWIPDAFIGPTASLMQAIQEDGVPETDGDDNLQTLRVVEAAYLSAAENRSVNSTSARRCPARTDLVLLLFRSSCGPEGVRGRVRGEGGVRGVNGTSICRQSRHRHRRGPGHRQGRGAAAGARRRGGGRG